jgi:hypothetical protein
MAGLEQVLRHGGAHAAKPDETYIHVSFLVPASAMVGEKRLSRRDGSPP